MSKTKLILDLSSVLGAFLHLKDEEFGRDIVYEGEEFHIPDLETSMERFKYSVSNVVVEPEDFIVVKDPGGKPKARMKIMPQYKQRPRKTAPEFMDARIELFDAATDWLRSQGAIIATPKNFTEADDLINELAKRLPETCIWTRDKDLLACPTNVLYQDKNGFEWNPEKFPVGRDHIHIYRTIVEGDKSDNVPSCKGFGPAAWDKLLKAFGGEECIDELNECLKNQTLHELDDSDSPELKKIIDQAKDLYKIYNVLSFQPVPAHMVRWEGGVKRGRDTLVTTENFDSIYNHIASLEFDYSVIDYEGDVCEESREWSEVSEVKVDVLAQEITGMGLRIGTDNWYFSVNHRDTSNLSLDQLESILELLWGKKIYAHNAAFENTLTYNHFEALLPEMEDTMLMASYVDEDDYKNLKHLSKRWLDYRQATYAETIGDKSGMSEVSGEEVLRYGLDDVITTDGLANLFIVILQYEGTYDIFQQVENDALYFTTLAFIHGIDFDWDEFKKLKEKNDADLAESWEELSEMLLALGWEGGEFKPVKGLNAATVNKVHKMIHGKETGATSVAGALREIEDPKFVELVQNKDLEGFNAYYHQHWEPAAEFNVRSPKQMSTFMYEVLELPVRVRNSPTEKMKKAGKPGNPAANEDAIRYAIVNNDTDKIPLLEKLLEYKGYLTKESLFLSKYPLYVHWNTERIHANLQQCATTTRRFACSKPNLQQLPKKKGKEFRNMLKSRKGYTMVALDWSGQELRIAADDSQDPNFVACYVGDNKKDPHSLTGLQIAQAKGERWDYDTFVFLRHGGSEEVDEYRTLGKKTNFTAQYGAMPPKVAITLLISEREAGQYLASRARAFPRLMERVTEWHAICRKKGYAETYMGARRHLAGHKYYGSRKEFEKEAADRQSYSMRIQGSAAEMAKLAMGTLYREGLISDQSDDILPMMQIHDELVVQVKDELVDYYMPKLVDVMCRPYSTMAIPMETEPEIGKLFGSLKDYEKEKLNAEKN